MRKIDDFIQILNHPLTLENSEKEEFMTLFSLQVKPLKKFSEVSGGKPEVYLGKNILK